MDVFWEGDSIRIEPTKSEKINGWKAGPSKIMGDILWD